MSVTSPQGTTVPVPEFTYPEKRYYGHPPVLAVLFFTEMWERFSYYGMRALLVAYMTTALVNPSGFPGLGFNQDRASEIYGLYGTFVYISPLLGGFLADRYLGQRKAVIVGSVLMAIGHIMMAFDHLFFGALGFLILGNGFFKPNIGSQIGFLYKAGDPKRDQGFSIFYMGVNLGAMIAPLICGILAQIYGWHYGFAAAGIGMVAGLIVYISFYHLLPLDALGRRKAADQIDTEAKAALRAAAKQSDNAITRLTGLSPVEQRRVLALFVMILLVAMFWAVYNQVGNTIALFAQRNLDRNILGWEFPSAWIQSVNPFLILALTPLLAMVWTSQARKGREPDSVAKMGIGCLLLAVSFFLLSVPSEAVSHGEKVSLFWILGFFVILTAGELYLSPIGLSFVTKVAPERMLSLLMAVWYLGPAAGYYATGQLGKLWLNKLDYFQTQVAWLTAAAHGQTWLPDTGLEPTDFFLLMGAIAVVPGLLMLAIARPLRRALAAEQKTAPAADETPAAPAATPA